MRVSILLLFALFILIIEDSASEPINKCYFCVKVLQCVHGQLGGHVRSKRLLENKLTGVCKRYPEYKRSCLKITKKHIEKIFVDLQPANYDPLKTCTQVQECQAQNPLTTPAI